MTFTYLVIATALIIFAAGCIPKTETKIKFKYGDTVKIKDGFYKDLVLGVYEPPSESGRYTVRRCQECSDFHETFTEQELELYEPSR